MLGKSSSAKSKMEYPAPRVVHLGPAYYLQSPSNPSTPAAKNQCNNISNNNNYMFTSSSSASPPSIRSAYNSSSRLGTTIPNRIFVGGLSAETTEAELEGLFSTYGTVTAVKIINDKSGPKGVYRYGFVTFETEEQARRVLKEFNDNNLVLRGRKLNVAIAVKKQHVRLDGLSMVANGPLVYPPNSISITALVNETGAPYGFGGEGLYPMTMPPSATSLGSTYPIIYPQPIYLVQQAPVPPPCSYPKIDTIHAHPQLQYQGTASTPSSFQGQGPLQYPTAGTYLASANGNSANAGIAWRWPHVSEFPMVNVNPIVSLNK